MKISSGEPISTKWHFFREGNKKPYFHDEGKCLQADHKNEPGGFRELDVLISPRCDAGYTGQHCEKKDYSVLYVVPGPVRFQYVLIAAVIGTIQIAVICVVVLCITRLVAVLRDVLFFLF